MDVLSTGLGINGMLSLFRSHWSLVHPFEIVLVYLRDIFDIAFYRDALVALEIGVGLLLLEDFDDCFDHVELVGAAIGQQVNPFWKEVVFILICKPHKFLELVYVLSKDHCEKDIQNVVFGTLHILPDILEAHIVQMLSH